MDEDRVTGDDGPAVSRRSAAGAMEPAGAPRWGIDPIDAAIASSGEPG